MDITPNQSQRIKSDWEVIAKEPIDLQIIGGQLYAFCSELAAYRIAMHYKEGLFEGTAKVDFSENLKSWFFRLEI